MESPKTQKMKALFLNLILFAVAALIALWGVMQYFAFMDALKKPYLIQVDFNGDSSWDASFLADSYDSDGNHLIMRFGGERFGGDWLGGEWYSIEYSSFLATKLDIDRNEHEPGPLNDAQAEKILELSKEKEGSEW